jgi:hypothetical protein
VETVAAGAKDSWLKKLIGWRVVHPDTSALVKAILILPRAEGNQHLHLWLQMAEVSRIQNRPCYPMVLLELEQKAMRRSH